MKKLAYLLSAMILIACESRTYEEISDNTPVVGVVNYTADIKPIVDANCISCHSTAGGALPLTSYSQMKGNIDIIINRLQRPNGDPLKMPQGGSLSSSQINLFIKWKADGLIEN